jgi:undecaprenyl-diphosphatase
MSFLLFLQAAFLGIIEGVTEFLPISSTGHLILVGDLLGFQGPPGKMFEISIQMGAILAVCWLYQEKLIETVRAFFHSVGARRFVVNLFLAFFPAVVLGAAFYKIIRDVLFSPWVVSVALVVGGILILIIERLPVVTRPKVAYDRVEDVPLGKAVAVGFFQCLAMIPGTSRSAATIMGALLMGVTRRAAAEFSFLLAIPTMLAATVYSVYKNRADISSDGLEVVTVGFVMAFLVALFVVRWAIAFISRHGFAVFAYYRIVLGAIMLVLLWARGVPAPTASENMAVEHAAPAPQAQPDTPP